MNENEKKKEKNNKNATKWNPQKIFSYLFGIHQNASLDTMGLAVETYATDIVLTMRCVITLMEFVSLVVKKDT